MFKSKLVPMLSGALANMVSEFETLGYITNDTLAAAHNVLGQATIIPKDYMPSEELALMYASGMSTWEIAGATGIKQSTIVQRIKKHGGVKLRPTSSSVSPYRRGQKAQDARDRAEKMYALREQGKTLGEIGAEFKVSRERVRQLLVEHGFPATRAMRPEELKAVDEYVRGDSAIEVAERNGFTTHRLKKLVNQAGHKMRPSPRSKRRSPHTMANAMIAAKMYNEGKTLEEIANTIGTYGSTVYRLLAIMGVKANRSAIKVRREKADYAIREGLVNG